MFTGIIEEVGKIKSFSPGKLTIAATLVIDGTVVGDSIAVNGACLTVTGILNNSFTVDVMEETRRRTNIGKLHVGSIVNLERALRLGGRMGGHLVQGHVDDTGKVISITNENDATLIKIEATRNVMSYIVEKGFVAVNGISLTIVRRDATSFVVSIVQYTRQHTILSELQIGDIVNLEIDIIAKYVEQLMKPGSNGLSEDFLKEHGFA
jgi:riboflavin synthase